ncbi:tetratricopeptide repeat protein [Pseudofrankia sp. EUN1h]|uniref:tetratricopeptide repeat protein n=1 Tax=Pseudofrankia sp. EUN1h TaxID=1834515 RepID=UPI0002E01877|nr:MULTISPECIES: tetratricopeptide repeat protein [Pseudofrankia]
MRFAGRLSGAHTLAIRLAEAGNHAAARALAEDTLTRRRRILGDNHPNPQVNVRCCAGKRSEVGLPDLRPARTCRSASYVDLHKCDP